MSRNSLKFFSLGCLLGSMAIYYKYHSLEELNKKLLSEIDSLKNNGQVISNDHKNLINNHIHENKNLVVDPDSNMIVDPKKIPMVYYYNHHLHNDIIFKFLVNSYFPDGLIILALKIFDFRKKIENNESILENKNLHINKPQEITKKNECNLKIKNEELSQANNLINENKSPENNSIGNQGAKL
jgi:hypothetical protein